MHSFPGFSRLRMHTKGGSPVAFVEYQDVRYAAQAMATLQGSFLLSSDRGAIRIEYAKSKMAEVGFTNLWIEVGFILCYASCYQSVNIRRRKRSTPNLPQPFPYHDRLHSFSVHFRSLFRFDDSMENNRYSSISSMEFWFCLNLSYDRSTENRIDFEGWDCVFVVRHRRTIVGSWSTREINLVNYFHLILNYGNIYSFNFVVIDQPWFSLSHRIIASILTKQSQYFRWFSYLRPFESISRGSLRFSGLSRTRLPGCLISIDRVAHFRPRLAKAQLDVSKTAELRSCVNRSNDRSRDRDRW